MISIDLRDIHIVENVKAIMDLKSMEIFSDNEIQDMYDRQVLKDRERTIAEMKEGCECQSV